MRNFQFTLLTFRQKEQAQSDTGKQKQQRYSKWFLHLLLYIHISGKIRTTYASMVTKTDPDPQPIPAAAAIRNKLSEASVLSRSANLPESNKASATRISESGILCLLSKVIKANTMAIRAG